MATRARILHEFAVQLSNCPNDEINDNIVLLFTKLVSQNPALFTSIISKNLALVKGLLRVSPEVASALLHTNNLTYNGFARLKRGMAELLGFKIFPCKYRILDYDIKSLEFMTEANFEVTKLDLYHTSSSSTPSPCGAIRARNLRDMLTMLVTRTRKLHGGSDTRNPFHPLYKGRILVLLESDKGGFSMKFAWRIGPNSLQVIGAYEATDNRANIMIFMAPWFDQLRDILENGLMVKKQEEEWGVEEDMADQEFVDDVVLEDLRSRLPAVEVTSLQGETAKVTRLHLEWVPDSRVREMIIDLPEEVVGVVDQELDKEVELQEQEQEQEQGNVGEEVNGEGAEREAGQEHGGDSAEFVTLPVDVIHVSDMAGYYSLLGLSGAAGIFPSPFTLVPKEHLASHTTSGLPHNWEQEDCRFALRTPENLHRDALLCSMDRRNNGVAAKNARNHNGSKAAPIIPFAPGVRDLLTTIGLPLLHLDLGILGKWLLDHMQLNARIIDQKGNEDELQLVTDLLLDETSLQEELATTPAQLERLLEDARLAAVATELDLAKTSLQVEQSLALQEGSYRARLVAVGKGEAGRKELLALCRSEGHQHRYKKFETAGRNLACHPHCLLTGTVYCVLSAMCSSRIYPE